MPQVKLISIMREPVERAWSEIKLNHRLGKGVFAHNPDYMKNKLDSFSRQQLVELMTFEWIMAHSDYLGCLQRWLSVFPPDQVYIGFYENLWKTPKRMLEELFAFLGVNKKVDWSGFRMDETINPSAEVEVPAEFELFARSVFYERTRE